MVIVICIAGVISILSGESKYGNEEAAMVERVYEVTLVSTWQVRDASAGASGQVYLGIRSLLRVHSGCSNGCLSVVNSFMTVHQ